MLGATKHQQNFKIMKYLSNNNKVVKGTKTELNEFCVVERKGFSDYKYRLQIKVLTAQKGDNKYYLDLTIEKDFNSQEIISIQSDCTEDYPIDEFIGECSSKKEFINEVQEWLSSRIKFQLIK